MNTPKEPKRLPRIAAEPAKPTDSDMVWLAQLRIEDLKDHAPKSHDKKASK